MRDIRYLGDLKTDDFSAGCEEVFDRFLELKKD
jgi:hypothetical protein